MKQLFNKLGGKSDKKPRGGDPEREAAKAIEEARREAAGRHGGGPTFSPSSRETAFSERPAPEAPRKPTFVEREPEPPPAPPPGSKFVEVDPEESRAPRPPSAAPPPSSSGASRRAAPPSSGAPAGPPMQFGGPPAGTASAGPSSTPDEERRAITDMALEDLRAARRASAGPDVSARLPADELERRRPPAPGESLPGVPPPHIPSEDLRDQALAEILERKERLDREYREKEGMKTRREPARKGKLHGLAAKARAPEPQEPEPQEPESQAPAERETRAPRPAPRTVKKKTLKKKLRGKAPGAAKAPEPEPEPEPEPAPEPVPVGAATTGEAAEEVLAGIKGVGPVLRSALLERFESVEAIRDAAPDELTEVDGVGPALAKRIKAAL